RRPARTRRNSDRLPLERASRAAGRIAAVDAGHVDPLHFVGVDGPLAAARAERDPQRCRTADVVELALDSLTVPEYEQVRASRQILRRLGRVGRRIAEIDDADVAARNLAILAIDAEREARTSKIDELSLQ